MSERIFAGFPSGAEVTPVPNLFFTAVMPKISSTAELKMVLHIFWLLSRRRGYPQFVTGTELLADRILTGGLEASGVAKEEVLREALRQAVEHGIVLSIKIERAGQPEDIYFINSDTGREAISKIEQGQVPQLPPAPDKGYGKSIVLKDIFSLYERNIGMLTPLIAEQLQEAERLYPSDWIEAAFKEAASLNKRSWKYILRILERWSIEGKDDGKFRGDTEKKADREKYIRGKYGHMVKG
jgi:DNA replication protein